jgi:hypothetical protein
VASVRNRLGGVIAMLETLLLPFGGPGDIPPCIRQRPFGVAGDWQQLPRLVFAPHRGLKCMGLIL